MRDRLEELQQRAQEFSDTATENTNPFSMEGDNDDPVVVGVITPQAVVFEEEPVVENFLSEVQQIRDDIIVLDTEVRFIWGKYTFFTEYFLLYNIFKYLESAFKVKKYLQYETLIAFVGLFFWSLFALL